MNNLLFSCETWQNARLTAARKGQQVLFKYGTLFGYV